MSKFRLQDFEYLGKCPTAPGTLCNTLTEILYSSLSTRCRVESVNTTTGEYRIVLQGTLDKENSRFDESW